MYAPPLISSLSAASLAKTPASQQAWVSLGGCIAIPAHVLGVLLRPPRAAPAITVPISCRQTSREQGCPPDPPPTAGTRHPCAKPFTQRCKWLPVHEYVPKGLSCLPATGIIVSSDGSVGMNTLHSVSLAWCVAETARSGPKAPSPNDRQREIEREKERGQVGLRERTPGSERAPQLW